jgi:hypothetical protein
LYIICSRGCFICIEIYSFFLLKWSFFFLLQSSVPPILAFKPLLFVLHNWFDTVLSLNLLSCIMNRDLLLTIIDFPTCVNALVIYYVSIFCSCVFEACSPLGLCAFCWYSIFSISL